MGLNIGLIEALICFLYSGFDFAKRSVAHHPARNPDLMKTTVTRTLFFLLLFVLPFTLFAQHGELEKRPRFQCPVNCSPCGSPTDRYLTNIYPYGWGPVYDIPYSTTADGTRTFDFYGYIDDCEARSLVVLLPGSGFHASGSIKTIPSSILKATYFAQRGYAVAVVDYHRVIDPCAFQERANTVIHKAAQDVHAALQFLVGNAATLNIDPANIFVIGESAGGVAGLSALFSGTDGLLLQSELQSSNIGADYTLNARTKTPYKDVDYCVKAFAGISTAVPTKGIFDNRLRHIDLPMMFVHGNGDVVVPFGLGYPEGCSEAILAQPFCGSGCIVERIKKNTNNRNCYKLNEVNTSSHNPLSYSNYQALYLEMMKVFFYQNMHCESCESYHRTYTPPTGKRPFAFAGEAEFSPQEISVFPNPVDALLNIRGVDPRTAITLTSLLGKVVVSTSFDQDSGTLDVSDLTPGVYLLTWSSNELLKTEKLVIQ